jgi:hypothetical protein
MSIRKIILILVYGAMLGLQACAAQPFTASPETCDCNRKGTCMSCAE